MIKRILSIALLAIILFSLPVLAEEQLMTRLYFDNWLSRETQPLTQQVQQLRAVYAAMADQLRFIRSQLTTEIKLVIGKTTAWIDGASAILSVAPVIKNDRTMVPVRFIGEAFGAQFLWDEKTRRVTYSLDDLEIILTIDSSSATVSGQKITLDAPPYIIDGRTMVPLRFVGQYMQASFEWDAASQTVTIYR